MWKNRERHFLSLVWTCLLVMAFKKNNIISCVFEGRAKSNVRNWQIVTFSFAYLCVCVCVCNCYKNSIYGYYLGDCVVWWLRGGIAWFCSRGQSLYLEDEFVERKRKFKRAKKKSVRYATSGVNLRVNRIQLQNISLSDWRLFRTFPRIAIFKYTRLVYCIFNM